MNSYLAFFAAMLLLLPGCASAPSVSPQTAPPAASEAIVSSSAPASQALTPAGSTLLDPPYDFDPDEMVPSDFGDFFTKSYPTSSSSYPLLEGTEWENEVTVLTGEEDGPTIYVVAGIHGDEIAGWNTGKLLKKISIKAGRLCILAPANRWGAEAQPRTRYITEKQDLNRSFPGNPLGTAAERIADSIYTDIERQQPVFLFDLHEARTDSSNPWSSSNVDTLGSSLIYSSLDNMGDLFMDLILATQTGELCSESFNFFAPGPIGSINNTVTNSLNLPVITVETYRGKPLEVRISDQLDIVQYVLRDYGMIE